MQRVHIVTEGLEHTAIITVFGSRKEAESLAIKLAEQDGFSTNGYFRYGIDLLDVNGQRTGFSVNTLPVLHATRKKDQQ